MNEKNSMKNNLMKKRKGLEEILSISGSLDGQEMIKYFMEEFKVATRLITEYLRKIKQV